MTAVRLKKPWKIWPIGHVIPEMPAGQAGMLIARGIVEKVEKAAPAPAAMKSPADRMMKPSNMLRKAAR